MSYCRFGEGSDVYLFATSNQDGEDCWCCCGCLLAPETNVYTFSEQATIDHLLRHRAAGHQVRQRAIERLEHERDGKPYETDIERALREQGL